ncbi:MAG: hypothetical protein F6K48_21850 [Okeania sp. SIO3H1]|uniref:hypothetical protein n=1 Tax=Okeania sp. SIO1I7 TaxID=2607772 RepID=UPI0013C89AB0|nr:hypothetical protein [Okeania sp. SIO1I7]NEN91404.1 hypothetical protein [Okeania sp. SIO3H1]NET28829.1 hypothetical protein [Okeania sp. SIO1I7]
MLFNFCILFNPHSLISAIAQLKSFNYQSQPLILKFSTLSEIDDKKSDKSPEIVNRISIVSALP